MKTINGKALLSSLIIDVDKDWNSKQIVNVDVGIAPDKNLHVSNAGVYDLGMSFNNEVIKISTTEKFTNSLSYVDLKSIQIKTAGLYCLKIQYKITDAIYYGALKIFFGTLTPIIVSAINNTGYIIHTLGPYKMNYGQSILVQGLVSDVINYIYVKDYGIYAKDYYSQPLITLE